MEELLKEYNDIVHKLGEKNIHRYNLGTINNFILHFNEVKTHNKDEVYTAIKEYLFFIIEMEQPKRLRDTHHLYTNFIYPLIKFYTHLKFGQYVTWSALILGTAMVDIIILILQGGIWWHVALLSMSVLIKTRVYVKQHQNKLYGLGW